LVAWTTRCERGIIAEGSAMGAGGIGAASVPVAAAGAGAAGAAPLPLPQEASQPPAWQPQLLHVLQQLWHLWQWKMSSRLQ